MSEKEEINPLWLRLWHALQAGAFVGLLATGVSMHYAGASWAVIPFRLAVPLHNALGALSAALWFWFVLGTAMGRNRRNYRIERQGWCSMPARQLRYYAIDMFRGRPAPFPPRNNGESKFNPGQKLAYVLVMFVLMPVSIVSGMILMFPIVAPAQALGWGGLWPAALSHLSAGYLLTLFVLAHAYMATTGATVFSLYAEMLTGVRRSYETPPTSD